MKPPGPQNDATVLQKKAGRSKWRSHRLEEILRSDLLKNSLLQPSDGSCSIGPLVFPLCCL